MTTLYCLINIDDVNYKLTMKLDDDRVIGNFDDFLKAIATDNDPDLKKYDFGQEFFIFELYDKSLNEYVRIDDDTEFENFSKVRVKILDPNEIITEPEPPFINEDELTFAELEDYKDDVELVELYAQAHIPDPDIIKIIDNSNITAETFRVNNVRIKKQIVKTVIKYQGLFKAPGAVYEQCWEFIVNDVRDNIGERTFKLIRDRNYIGFNRIWFKNVEKEFLALIGQYNRLLRMCQCLTPQLAERLWPFFKIFHKSLRIEHIYPEREASLKIMQKEFDNAKKITVL
ncbi:uncharacterized protein LOC107361132 [Tetranychus urticae]|uniref:Uncharacterized protein n=1 Tax=Tetranychus urticae TaxID=32264 RepID=T1K6R4_TETUR|nr:uncharacterized protein LOC107361132 [Tetranychus urticae]